MKKYKRKRTYRELKKLAAKFGWKFNDNALKAGSSDFIQIEFVAGKIRGMFLISSVNGWFFGNTEDGLDFNSNDTANDRKPWFKALLNFAYTN